VRTFVKYDKPTDAVCEEALGIRGREWQAFGKQKRARLLESAFQYWRQNGFPHYTLGTQQIRREYRHLIAQPIPSMSRKGVGGSIVGLRLANYFHPHMWSVRVSRYLSPYDVFHDDTLLRSALRRSWTVWPDRFGANSATLRRMLKTYPGAASVSNFRPTVARAVLHHFSNESDSVVDFSAGYGGRLLGALSMKRTYIGIEPCKAQVLGLRSMLKIIKKVETRSSAEVLAGCAEDVMPLLPKNSASLVFSSPPYFDWERYSDEESQSFIKYCSYETWKKGFLEPVIRQSRRILKKGGKLVVNLSSGRRKPEAGDLRIIALAMGFRDLGSIPLLISRVPYLHPRTNMPHKREAILIFEKI
jgi:SAM-dependent methyltransferase